MGLLHAVFRLDRKGIYTTPLKALSNQKYSDLIPTFGHPQVGLSTGDVSIHKRTAVVTVMTTEVYRNMAWRATGQSSSTSSSTTSSSTNDNAAAAQLNDPGEDKSSDLDDTAVVVFDEFRYMGLPGRGGVWEESVITSPSHVQMIALSATLPNADDLCRWMESVTQRTTVLVQVSQQRPVPLRYLYATKEGLYPLFRDPDAGPGSPHGLLGLRGDGYDPRAASSSSKKAKNSGFGDVKRKSDKRGGGGGGGDDDSGTLADDKIPRGLHVNPALRAAAEKRMQRVNRSLERQKAQARYGGGGRYTMYDSANGYKNNNNDEFVNDDDLGWFRKTSRSRSAGGALSPREERKERERLLKKELRRSVPSLPALVSRLSQKSLLPAIIFIFSRAGCDDAARTLYQTMKGPRDPNHLELEETQEFQESFRVDGLKRQTRQRGVRRTADALVQDASGRTFRPSNSFVSEDVMMSLYEPKDLPTGESFSDDEFSPFSSENWGFYAAAGLLEQKQVREVAARASRFNDDNPEIAFDDEVIEQFLFGVGSHHAGMLPAHKSFVESLYRNQLMKVVFATETLAAGINMPARTTVICSLAKRGDGSTMNLLETSNLLQMAGRAGRRGMDSDGTCVILATPFETHDDAARILTDPIKPITSQFTPSYALCVNLIARGQGKLDVARQLVGKSFAMWERNKVEQSLSTLASEAVDDVVQTSAEQRFVLALAETLQLQVDRKSALYDVAKVQKLIKLFDDREVLKKTSKSYIGAKRVLELEHTTLKCLESELEAIRDLYIDEDLEETGSLVSEDEKDVLEQIEVQQQRLIVTGKEVSNHPFTTIAGIANDIMQRGVPEGMALARALQQARRESDDTNEMFDLTPDELSQFSKSAIVLQRMARKLAVGTDMDPSSVVELTEQREARDDSWEDLVAITRTLLSYGCLSTDPPYSDDVKVEDLAYSITPAGANVAMLGFENALWCVVAIGGAWDVASASSRLDTYRRRAAGDDPDWYDDEDKNEAVSDSDTASLAQQEADKLVQQLRALSSSELAGYVSCLVSEGSRSGFGGPSVAAARCPVLVGRDGAPHGGPEAVRGRRGHAILQSVRVHPSKPFVKRLWHESHCVRVLACLFHFNTPGTFPTARS
jgi:replicative superfamily II helicase